MDTSKVTRIEVIDHTKEDTCEHLLNSGPNIWTPGPHMWTSGPHIEGVICLWCGYKQGGRVYTFWDKYRVTDIPNPKVEVMLQDDGRTLKVFIRTNTEVK